ncbi:MAG: hypothetical protein JXQ91_01395 [Vannielia sp.]|uniref:hypothetical protein n=1 Tax=Rhodobacterales TaxID=204455 RepID=UPI002095DFFC|nr:hypothetical protein [Oceanicola sp. 502str15]MCO6382417.1 hypothetical protein [Oceanicola sp. 502str15]
MSDDEDPTKRRKGTPFPEGPSVVYLRMPALAKLPPDSWFEDAEGDEAVRRAEEERLQRLRLRQSRA